MLAMVGLMILTAVCVLPPGAVHSWEGAVESSPLQYTIHITGGGLTLCDIAADPENYGSCLKWPQIYYYNWDEITPHVTPGADLPFTPLPDGLSLAIILPGNAQNRAEKMLGSYSEPWTINVMSRASSRDLAPLAAKLMIAGNYCYITKFTTTKTIWKRLRVGFFPTLNDAKAKQAELKERFGLDDAWITKATPAEAREFLGYLE